MRKAVKAWAGILLILGTAGFGLAAEHGHGHAQTPEMRRQHNSMSITKKQWAVLKKSLAAGDYAAAGASLARLQKAAGELEKFKLHKNADRMEEFREQSRIYRENLDELGKAIKEKDRTSAKDLSVTIDKGCQQCHDGFR